MKTIKDYRIKFEEKQIVITKSFAHAGNAMGSRAYNQIKKLCKDYPEFSIVLKTSEIRDENKKTYKYLTIAKMREVIIERGEFSKLKVLDKAIAEKVPYPKIKQWFLKEENFKDYAKNEMPEEELLLAEGEN